MRENSLLQLKIDLTGEYQKWFLDIKKRYSFVTNTELIRFLIKNFIDSELISNQTHFNTPKTRVKMIENLLQRPEFKEKYNVFTVQEFIAKSVELFINKIRNDSKSILHWEIKSKLQGLEKEIAIVFTHCYFDSKTGCISAKEIAEKLKKRDIQKVTDVLDSFVTRYMLDFEIIDDNKLYYVNM